MWLVHLADEQVLKARYVISATGILNQPVRPNIEGIDSFKGKMIHTARWDHDYDINDKKVAVIGTGASAVQLVPAIADKVKQLKVYQRTPIWVVPKKEREFDEQAQERFKKWPVTQSVIRFLTDLRIQSETWCILNYRRFPFVTKFVEKELAKYLASQVADPELRKKLTPHYGFGCKRPSLSNTYLKTFNKQNVRLITEGIQKITTKGIVTNDGEEHELDTIILGTGFKTFEPGNSPSYTVQGLQGLDLGQFWEQNRYQAYRGVSVPNFPNYFMTFGPYTGGFNWFSMLESQLRYIVRCIVKANKKGATYVEVSQKAHDKDFQATLKKSKDSVFQSPYCLSANSYYFDAKGDPSLPSVISPLRRWIITKFAGHRGFLFK
jgi:cation diffusion facilitator CzcD-associated flavoprotein CzcO